MMLLFCTTKKQFHLKIIPSNLFVPEDHIHPEIVHEQLVPIQGRYKSTIAF